MCRSQEKIKFKFFIFPGLQFIFLPAGGGGLTTTRKTLLSEPVQFLNGRVFLAPW